MKKKAVFALGFVVLVFLSWMGYTGVQKLNKKEAVEDAQSTLSEMLNRLGRSDVDIAQSSILVFFNSECEHCQWEIEQLDKNLEKCKKHQLLLTSFEPENEALAFLRQHNLSDFYLKSPPEKVMSAYTGGIPQTLLYQNGKLIKHFKGEVKIESVLNAFSQE